MDAEVIPVGRFRTKHFVIPVPDPEAKYERDKVYECKNTRTGESVQARYTGGSYTYPWIKLPDSFCITHFDVPTSKLKAALELSFPALKNIEYMRFLIMKEI